jgi:hypothetical protein
MEILFCVEIHAQEIVMRLLNVVMCRDTGTGNSIEIVVLCRKITMVTMKHVKTKLWININPLKTELWQYSQGLKSKTPGYSGQKQYTWRCYVWQVALTLNYSLNSYHIIIPTVGIFWQFSVKMWMFNFWCFPKDDCFILVLFKWLEKK